MRIIIFLAFLIAAVLTAPPGGQISSRQDDSSYKQMLTLRLTFIDNDQRHRQEWNQEFDKFLNQFISEDKAGGKTVIKTIDVTSPPGQSNSHQDDSVSEERLDLHVTFGKGDQKERQTWLSEFQSLLSRFLREFQVGGRTFVKTHSTSVPLPQQETSQTNPMLENSAYQNTAPSVGTSSHQVSSQVNQGQASTAASQETNLSLADVYEFFYTCPASNHHSNLLKSLRGVHKVAKYTSNKIPQTTQDYRLEVRFQLSIPHARQAVIERIKEEVVKEHITDLDCLPPIPGFCEAPPGSMRRL